MIEYSFDGKTLWVNDIDSGMTIEIHDIDKLKRVLGIKNG
jgi:hypothetical protein